MRSRHWGITWENYSEQQETRLKEVIQNEMEGQIVYHSLNDQLEETTPHLHAYIYFKNARTFQGVQRLFHGAHIENKAVVRDRFRWKNYMANRNKWDPDKEPWEYNSDDGYQADVEDNNEVFDVMAERGGYLWQEEIMDLLELPPDDRTIYWVYEKNGSRGKTALLKHIKLTLPKVKLVGGNRKDMKYACQGKPEIVIVNLTRRTGNKMSYEGIEAVKDGIFFSEKYESNDVVMNCPHVLIVANEPPQWTQLSPDRWEVYKITRQKRLKRQRNPYLDFSDNGPEAQRRRINQ